MPLGEIGVCDVASDEARPAGDQDLHSRFVHRSSKSVKNAGIGPSRVRYQSLLFAGLSGIEIATRLLEQAGVATVAGEYFGNMGAGHIRISYANSLENLKLATEKIAMVMNDLAHE